MEQGAALELRISYKGKQLDVRLPQTATVGSLQTLLAERTGIQVEHQKIIYRGRTIGRTVADSDATLASLFPGPMSGQQHLNLALVGATSAEIRELQAAAEAAAKGRGRVIDDLRLLSSAGGADTQRRRTGGGLRRRQYGFGRIEVLPGPDQERARAILEELAEDPGVLHVMSTFKWSVGALCELYPEVSRYNKERGEESACVGKSPG